MVDDNAVYIRGSGRAHKNCEQYEAIFGHKMRGTFNVQTVMDLAAFKPARVVEDKRFYLVKVNGEYGWAVRWDRSRQRRDRWEIISKTAFPEATKDGMIRLEVMERWGDEQVEAWANGLQWFQSFPWSPQRADSGMVWDAIKDRVDWRNKSVLDIGCNFGFYSFQASRAGARVRGIDKNENVIKTAQLINDHIEMQDVQFSALPVQAVGRPVVDVLLYFSVQHQFDRGYAKLKKYLNTFWALTRECVFVELIVPSMDGGMSEKDIDLIVDGEALLKYRHKVRGWRKLYEIRRTHGG